MINEKYFNIGLAVIVGSIIEFLIYTGKITADSVIGQGAAIGFNCIILLVLGFGLQFFQAGIGRDIQKEIYDEANIAAGIFQGAIWIALAIVISKSIG